ncbi:MAG: hypothetical protein U9N10_01280 [Bacillota bacterium]|nr:hypothetical protein [Bacillota bacterium]
MKKIIVLFFIVACIVGLLTACSAKNSNETIEFSFDANGNYTGFINLPTKYTVEDAEKDGYFLKQGLEVIANNDVWDNYIETASQGNNIGIRMVGFYTEDSNSPYFYDLFFNDGYYYLFDSSSENQEKQPFLYLLTLEGKFGNPLKDSGVVVLTNDNTLTFNDVVKSIISSNLDYIQSVSPYKLVMFQ